MLNKIFDRIDKIKQDIRMGMVLYWINGAMGLKECFIGYFPKFHYSNTLIIHIYFNPVNPVHPVRIF